MGEHAEVAIYAEMMGLDPEEAYLEYHENRSPAPDDVQTDMRLILQCFEDLKDEDSPPSSAEVFQMMFSDVLTLEEAEQCVKVMEKIVALELEDD